MQETVTGRCAETFTGVAIDKTVTAGARVLSGLDGLSTYACFAFELSGRTVARLNSLVA